MAFTVLGGKIRFDRNELAGSFGDLGTDFPLIVGMILVCGLDSASTLIVFGVLQILTGLLYGLPMPVQPLKAMAVLMISQKLDADLLYGGGLAIGIIMLVLTAAGLLEWLARSIPKTVVRGIQFGLGLSLASLALKDYVASEALSGYALAFAGFIITVALLQNRKYPPAIVLVVLGVVYAAFVNMDFSDIRDSIGLALPTVRTPSVDEVLQGFIILALPQLPLSISNSVIATRQTIVDFFPEKKMSLKRIGFTYSLMNIIAPFAGGIPTCHGAGGLAGHYTFGARTGGSVVLYGTMYLVLGFFFSNGFSAVIKVFPLPILGVILLVESLALMVLAKDIAGSKKDLFICLLVALIAFAVPHGYVVGLIVGTVLWYLTERGLTLKS